VRGRVAILVVAAVMLMASAGAAQFRRGGRFGYFPTRENPPYDGAFQFCRIMFRNAADGDGGGWYVDYPRADQNLSYRFSELTVAPVSSDGKGNFNHVLIRLTDEATLAHCPFIMLTEPGGTYLDEAEATALRVYLQKGGFLWADDFWGEYAWEHWMNEIRKALPSAQYPVADVPLDDGLFHMLYDVREIPQIPSIGAWGGPNGRTWERVDAKVPHVRAITDRSGHVLVLNTHNTDFGDAFEREGFSRAYFDTFAGPGYAFGVNALLYSMTH